MNVRNKLQQRVSNLLTLTHVLAVMTGVLSWFVLDVLFNLETGIAIVLGASVAVVIGLASALWESRQIGQLLDTIAKAVGHVAKDQHTGKIQPPQPMTLTLGSEYATTLIKEIYELASASTDIAAKAKGHTNIFTEELLRVAPVGVMAFDKQQELSFINPAMEKLLSPTSKIVGLDIEKVLEWQFQTDETYDKWLKISRENKIQDNKFWERVVIIKKDGGRIIGDLIANFQLESADGIETTLIFVDRTSEYIADQRQMDFVAVAAHELRGPITVIRGYLDVFLQEMPDVFTVDQRGLLQKMTVSAEQLAGYVNNILNVARIDQDAMRLHLRETDWREVVKEAYADLFLRARAHGRTLKLEIPKELPTVAVDRISITEVINNLVDNAIKYSKEGDEIIISTSERDGLISTTIQDFGIGIPDSVIGNLFKKFYRSHRSKQGVSGTGLGLYLSKSIVDAHGGNIWVRSKLDEGSTFGFDLPTYATVADTLEKGNNDGEGIKRTSHGWIKNHSMYRR